MPLDITNGKFVFHRIHSRFSWKVNGLYAYIEDNVSDCLQYSLRWNKEKKRVFLHMNSAQEGVIKQHLSIDYYFLNGDSFFAPAHCTMEIINDKGVLVTARIYFDANAVAIYVNARIKEGLNEIYYPLNDLETYSILNKVEYSQAILANLYFCKAQKTRQFEQELLRDGHAYSPNNSAKQAADAFEQFIKDPTQVNKEVALLKTRAYTAILQQYHRYQDKKESEMNDVDPCDAMNQTIRWLEHFYIAPLIISMPANSAASASSTFIHPKKTSIKINKITNKPEDSDIIERINRINRIKMLLDSDNNVLNFSILAQEIVLLEDLMGKCSSNASQEEADLLKIANERLKNKPTALPEISFNDLTQRIEELTKKNDVIIQQVLARKLCKTSSTPFYFSEDNVERDTLLLEQDLATLKTRDNLTPAQNKKKKTLMNSHIKGPYQTLAQMKSGMNAIFEFHLGSFERALKIGDEEVVRKTHAFLVTRCNLSALYDQLLYDIDGYTDGPHKDNPLLLQKWMAIADYFHDSSANYRTSCMLRAYYMRPTNIAECRMGALVFAFMHNNPTAFEMYLRQGILPDVIQYQDELNNMHLNTLQCIVLYADRPQAAAFAELLFKYGARLETESLPYYTLKNAIHQDRLGVFKAIEFDDNAVLKLKPVNPLYTVSTFLLDTQNYALLAVVLRHAAHSYDCSVTTLLSTVQFFLQTRLHEKTEFAVIALEVQKKLQTMHEALTVEQKTALLGQLIAKQKECESFTPGLQQMQLKLKVTMSIRILHNISNLNEFMQYSLRCGSFMKSENNRAYTSRFFPVFQEDLGKQLRNLADKQDHEMLIMLLSEHPKIVNEPGPKTGKTALHYAVFRKNIDCVAILLSYHANPDLEDNDKKTPRMMAEEAGDPRILRILQTLPENQNLVIR